MYEAFNPFTTVAQQHFIEWFSGQDIDSIWRKNQLQGSTTFVMRDVIDGGFEIRTAAAATVRGQIDFNNIRHYDENGCVVVGVVRNVTSSTSTVAVVGACSTAFNGFQTMNYQNQKNLTFMQILTRDSNSTNQTDSDINVDDTTWHSIKLEAFSASIVLDIDGVEKATNTTDLPTVRLQPCCGIANLTSVAVTGGFRYLEAYST